MKKQFHHSNVIVENAVSDLLPHTLHCGLECLLALSEGWAQPDAKDLASEENGQIRVLQRMQPSRCWMALEKVEPNYYERAQSVPCCVFLQVRGQSSGRLPRVREDEHFRP